MRYKRMSIRYRADRNRYVLRWWDGRARTEHFRTKREALARRVELQHQYLTQTARLPSDGLYATTMDEYVLTYATRGLSRSATTEAHRALCAFEDMARPKTTADVTQFNIDAWTRRLAETKSSDTVNKYLSRMRAFCHWCMRRKYRVPDIEWPWQRGKRRAWRALDNETIRGLLARAPSECWRMRILVSLCTGLRKTDVDDLRVEDVDLRTGTVFRRSQKTGKVTARPLPDALLPPLVEYMPAAGKVFPDRNAKNVFDRFRQGITRQDFRRTFSVLMQKISSPTAQELLEHCSGQVTEVYYTDESVLRWKINQLPVKEWLQWNT